MEVMMMTIKSSGVRGGRERKIIAKEQNGNHRNSKIKFNGNKSLFLMVHCGEE